jgi:AcrR family transcriptional regulator
MATRRKYELKERARRQEETRRRITEATVALHETVGPAHTQISEIARRAGVERLTVYKHFPDADSLFHACSAHWRAGHPPPDPEPWNEIADPRLRTRTALEAVYAYFGENEPMLANIIRDAASMPVLRQHLESGSLAYVVGVRDLILAGWRVRGRRRDRLTTIVDLALSFQTWHFLTRHRSLPSDQAAELMLGVICCTAQPP